MDTKTLFEKAEEIAKLSRNIGHLTNWYHEGNNVYVDMGDKRFSIAECSQYGDYAGDYSEFIAAAPSMAELIAEMASELAKYQWQPIETAPKDGEVILIYNCFRSGSVVEARWNEDAEKFSRLDEDWDVDGDYWMPLPKPQPPTLQENK